MKMAERERPKATPTLVNLPSDRGSSPVKTADGGQLNKEVTDSAPVTDYFADDL